MGKKAKLVPVKQVWRRVTGEIRVGLWGKVPRCAECGAVVVSRPVSIYLPPDKDGAPDFDNPIPKGVCPGCGGQRLEMVVARPVQRRRWWLLWQGVGFEVRLGDPMDAALRKLIDDVEKGGMANGG